jgi:hypothetical protein
MVDKNTTMYYNEMVKQKGELILKTKTVKLLYVGTLEKKVVSDEELKEVLQNPRNYEEKMNAYKQHWISEKFIEENADWINWSFLTSYQPLSEKVIHKYHLNIDFDQLVTYQKVSQKTLLNFRENINVDNLVRHQPMTEKFIDKYHDLFEMCWGEIVYYQNVSLQFLIKHKDRFDISDLESGEVDGQTIDNFKIFTKMGII